MPPDSPGNRVQRLLKSLNCDGYWGWALVLACLLLLAGELGGDGTRELLRYQRDAVASGEWWRLATAHLVHLGLHHALLNALGLALMWALFARDYDVRAWIAIIASAVAAIDVGLWVGDSTVQWYVGSSGALHGVMAAGTLAHLKRGEPDGWLLGVFLVVKLVYEQTVGALPLVGPGVVVVTDAHLYGALGGLLGAQLFGQRPRAAEPV